LELPESVELGLIVDLLGLADLLAGLLDFLGDLLEIRQGLAPHDRLLLLERNEEVVGCGRKWGVVGGKVDAW